VLCASSGTEGLEAVLAAIEHGKTVALANKEVLVMAGAIVTCSRTGTRRRRPPGRQRTQCDSSVHHGRPAGEIRKLILTASGGPFRGRSASELKDVTAADALKHPTWRMGRKITIDSATLMNKGLEVIEAHWLFGARADQIDVVIHPQSVVHSMVELTDGSIIAQLGATDMRLPIQYAFSYPERWPAALPTVDLADRWTVGFRSARPGRFPVFATRLSGARGRTQPAGRVECGQRSGGGAVPRAAAAIQRDCSRHSGNDGCTSARRCVNACRSARC
jgi:1-deoxy-D-xylulose-5-phosphate reductoisomerase